jgi:hypothetical protein
MASTPARFVYEALLSPDATPEVLRRVYEYADRVKDTDLLVSLTTHPKLDAELESILAARGEADILVAWSGRPGRSTEQLVTRFAKEKRATLLVALAGRGDLPEELYTQLANSGLATVCEAIALNGNAPLTARVRAASGITRRIKEGYNAPRTAKSMLASCPDEVVEAAALGSQRFGALAGIIDRCSESVAIQIAPNAVRLAAAVEGWNARHVLNDFWSNLESIPARIAFRDAVIAFNLEVQAGTAEVKNSYLEQYATINLEDPITVALHSMTASSDPIEVQEAFNLIMNTGGFQHKINAAKLAAGLESIPVQHLVEYSRHLDTAALEKLCARIGDDVATAASVINNSDRDAFEVFVSKGSNPEALFRAMFAEAKRLPYWVTSTSSFYKNTELVFDLISVNEVLKFDHGSAANAAKNLMLEQLGDNPERWETFERLAPEWSGSLPSLLDAVVGLS